MTLIETTVADLRPGDVIERIGREVLPEPRRVTAVAEAAPEHSVADTAYLVRYAGGGHRVLYGFVPLTVQREEF